MGKQYTIPTNGSIAASSGDVDLFELVPAEGRRCRVTGLRLGKLGTVEEGSENIRRITVRRLSGPVTLGSGGSAGVPAGVANPLHDPEFTVNTRNSGVAVGASGGTNDRVVDELAWNTRVQGEFSLNAVVAYPDVLVVRLEESLDEYEADFTGNGALVVEEATKGMD